MARKEKSVYSTNKTVKPGSKNATTAKFEKPTRLSSATKQNNNVKEAMAGEKKTQDAYRQSIKKGYLTQTETLILQKRKKTRKPVI